MNGPGTELASLLQAKAIECGSGLSALIARMDAWGVEGCNPRMDAIVDELLGESPSAATGDAAPRAAIVVQDASLLLRRRLEGIVTQAIETARSQDPTLVRHLMFHIMPTPGPAWRWHVERLIWNLQLFNGRRVIGIVTGPELDPPETVQAVFANHRIDRWIIRPNDRQLGEAVTFSEMLAYVQQDAWGVTFYGHAKGVTQQWTRPIENWCALMHQQLLAEWRPRVQDVLRRFAVVGAFRRVGVTPPVSVPWHYSGTFFWFRNADVQDHFVPMTNRYAVEEWPARMFRLEQSCCVYGEQCGSLYEESYWDRLPAWNTAALLGRGDVLLAGEGALPPQRQTRLFYDALALEQAGNWRGAWKTLWLAAVARRTSQRIGRWNIFVAMLRVTLTWFRVSLPRTYVVVRSIYRALRAPFDWWAERRRRRQLSLEQFRVPSGLPPRNANATDSDNPEDDSRRLGSKQDATVLVPNRQPDL